jgi:signal transduction histidine kinase
VASTPPGAVRALGVALLAIGTGGMLGWLLDVPLLRSGWPGLPAMKANTAVALAAAGVALVLVARGTRHAWLGARVAGGAIAILGLATLAEHLFAVNLGIDQRLAVDRDAFALSPPGRMAASTAVSLAVAGAGLIAAAQPAGRWAAAARAAGIAVTAMGALGVAGFVFGLELLHSWPALRTAALPSAAGILALGGGLWLASHRQRQAPSADARITQLAVWLVVLGAGITGLVAFAVLETQLERTLASSFRTALDARLSELESTVQLRTTGAAMIATRPNLLRHLELLRDDPLRAESRAVVQGVLDSFSSHGFSAIVVTLASGEVVGRLGQIIDRPALEVPLGRIEGAALLWRDGLYLRHHLVVGGPAGSTAVIQAEQPLLQTPRAAKALEELGATAEFLLCREHPPGFSCFPSRLTPAPFILPVHESGPARFAELARDRGAGFGHSIDYRDHRVLGAYGPLPELGLVAVLKVDADTVYGPIRRQFLLVIALIAGVALGGSALVRARVRPLAAALQTRLAELTRVNAALERSNRELQRFANVISHDLQTPLRSIVGFLQLLRLESGEALTERAREWLRRGVASAERLHALIRDLLDYARIDAEERPRGRADLQAIADSVVERLHAAIAESGGQVTRGAALPTVSGDAAQLAQLLENLVENGLKFRGAGAPRVHVEAVDAGEHWRLSVRDNGIGIEPAHQERIFEVFQRLEAGDRVPGTGIGLALSRRIVQRHGGRIWVQSEPGRGTEVLFTIPK